MLSRGFYDALAFWPTVAWPLIFSSALYCFLRLAQLSRNRYGVSPLDQDTLKAQILLYLFLPAAGLFEVAIHSYLLWTIGWAYVVLPVPIYIAGWILLPSLLEDFGPAQLLLPIAYICFAAAFVVLLGFVDIEVLRLLNRQLYSLLTGVYVSI